MAVAHFCPRCGTFSQQEGVWLWDVPCPNCGHHAPAVCHTPGADVLRAAREAYAAEQAAADDDGPVHAVGTIATGSGAT